VDIFIKMISSIIYYNTILCNAALPYQLLFQTAATPAFEGMISFHADIMMILVVILSGVFWIEARITYYFVDYKQEPRSALSYNSPNDPVLELVWTIIPALILLGISIPSFSLLYSVDEVVEPKLTIHCIGHQWLWSYQYAFMNHDNVIKCSFESYGLVDSDLNKGQLRLLETDHRVVLPVETNIRIITTSSDVIHCWAVPALGIKLDACPGRLNSVSLFVKREGSFFGQCSEICGVNHGFMPIAIDVVDESQFLAWINFKAEVIEEKKIIMKDFINDNSIRSYFKRLNCLKLD